MSLVSLTDMADGAPVRRTIRQGFSTHHKIIRGIEVEEIDGVEDSIVSDTPNIAS